MTVQVLLFRTVLCTSSFLLSVLVQGQTPNGLSSASVNPSSLVSATPSGSSNVATPSGGDNSSCSRWAVENSQSLTLKQRTCLYGRKLIAPQFALQAAAVAAFGRYGTLIVPERHGIETFPHRFATYYARNSAQDAASLLIGYLHHEDPRMHASGAKGVWSRTSAALLSVVASPDEDGNLRPAFAPVAGTLGSALVGTVMGSRHQDLSGFSIRAGLVYGSYFAHAVASEFKPEMMGLVHKFWH